jgi:hypothetical protein
VLLHCLKCASNAIKEHCKLAQVLDEEEEEEGKIADFGVSKDVALDFPPPQEH